ncbi:MAG: hypothetical protein BGN96_10805 [Bacteroidales bacterium 45-6]|nr:MAG: hypothetical protein BGN96_10805 [Bacteroidales bacterium 45-6]
MARKQNNTLLRNRIGFEAIWASMLAKAQMCRFENASPMQKTFVVAFSLLLFTSSSIEYSDKRAYAPVFIKRSELEKSVVYISEGRDLLDPGKIYVYGKYILVNERYKGIHLIDNSRPEAPRNIAFITVPGCLDMAVKDGILYVDNAVDLVAFDLTSHLVTNRIRNILPPPSSPDNMRYYRPEAGVRGKILVGWEKKKPGE